ncbi:hypothetical protein [Tunturiibacter gelidoferens]|uniref:Uncharacterized protein n=1 Tax=Tunturiibacter gelidiferens TaxID=3069689 RepID=A0ACC5NYA2_9BACT|nr:hypothetical protein [Edaphobacter lichenicola]MBB5339318.1 hypothetical protein [Edaphobacter lichenicola]
MSIHSCPDAALLIGNLVESLRRQCELPGKTRSSYEIALEMDTAEALQAAYRHAADHLVRCPVCRNLIASRRPSTISMHPDIPRQTPEKSLQHT